MIQSIVHIALVVDDYGEAIEFYTKKLNFELIEDIEQPLENKRWVVVSPLVIVARLYYWKKLLNHNKFLLWVIKQEEGYFSSCLQMISGVLSRDYR